MSEKRRSKQLENTGKRCSAKKIAVLFVLMCSFLVSPVIAQRSNVKPTLQPYPSPRSYPKEIRGYKVERAKVEIKRQKQSNENDESEKAQKDADALIQFGEATIARMTPLGITLEVPVTVAAVKQKGHVDFLTFEDMVVNDMPVTVEEYDHPFDLPTDKPTLLPKPVRLYISTSRAILGALGEWNEAKETWPVTGRVYVFGQYKKFIFKFKRVVPVELSLSLPNPLLNKKNDDGK